MLIERLRRRDGRSIWPALQIVLVLLAIDLSTTQAGLIVPKGMEIAEGLDAQQISQITEDVQSGDLAAARIKIQSAVGHLEDRTHPEVTLAQILINAGQQSAAMKVLEEFAASGESDYEAHVAFAEIAFHQHRWFDAWSHAQAAAEAELPPHWTEKKREQAEFDLLAKQALIANARQDWTGVETLTDRMLDSQPEHVDALVLKANAAFAKDDFEATEDFLRRATAAGSEDRANALCCELLMAQRFQSVGNVELTRNWFEAAIGLPNQEQRDTARIEFSKWLLTQNAPEELLEQLTSVEMESQTAQVGYLRGLALRMQRDYQAAETVFSELHQNNPANIQISNQLALVLIESTDEGKRARALQIAAANAKNTQQTGALCTLGWIQFRLGDPTAAYETLTKAFSGGRVSRDAAFYMSQVQQALGRTDLATSFEQAALEGEGEFFHLLALEPQDPE